MEVTERALLALLVPTQQREGKQAEEQLGAIRVAQTICDEAVGCEERSQEAMSW